MHIQDEPSMPLADKWRPILRTIFVLMGAMLVALQCGTTNAFNTIQDDIKYDLGLSDNLITLLASFGIIGLFFTIPAGMMNDRVGPFWTSFLGAYMAVGGYLAMSFTNKPSFAAMVICFTITGFGCGTSFLAALATGIKAIEGRPGVGVALVGACMSASMAITNQFFDFYKNVLNCDEHHCWPEYLRMLAVTSLVFMFFPSFLFLLVPDPPRDASKRSKTGESDALLLSVHSDAAMAYGEIGAVPSINSELAACRSWVERYALMQRVKANNPVTLRYSLQLLKNIFFWLVIYGYFAGIGAALLIITNTKGLWTTFTGGEKSGWAVNISTAFSLANMCGNLVLGALCDFLWDRFKISRHRLLAVLLLCYSGVFTVMAILSYLPSRDNGAEEIIYMILMVSVGFGFGGFLSLFPVLVGDYYGHVNFGMWFGYVQIGSCAATFVIPNVATSINSAMGDFNVMLIIMAVVLGTSAVGIFVKKPTPVGCF